MWLEMNIIYGLPWSFLFSPIGSTFAKKIDLGLTCKIYSISSFAAGGSSARVKCHSDIVPGRCGLPFEMLPPLWGLLISKNFFCGLVCDLSILKTRPNNCFIVLEELFLILNIIACFFSGIVYLFEIPIGPILANFSSYSWP